MKKTTLILLVTMIVAWSCSQEPHLVLSADKARAQVGEVVQFQSHSLNAYDMVWDFGDGSSSLAENPTHIYLQPGRYDVTLTAVSRRETSRNSQSIPIVIDASEYDQITGDYNNAQKDVIVSLIGRWRIFYASDVVTDCQTNEVDSNFSRITESIQYTLEFYPEGNLIITDHNGLKTAHGWELVGTDHLEIPDITLSGSLVNNPLTPIELGGLYQFDIESRRFTGKRKFTRPNSAPMANCDDDVDQTLIMDLKLIQ